MRCLNIPFKVLPFFSGLFFLVLLSATSHTQCLPPLKQEICLVTVDSSLNKNILIWEKTLAFDVKHYNIYRENTGGSYTKIGEVPSDTFSVYIDWTSDPDQRAERYKLSVVNNCNVESPLSDTPFRTIRLSGSWTNGNKDWECRWDGYEGFGSLGTALYKVFRGPARDQMVEVHSFFNLDPTHIWTDINVPAGTKFYRVEMLYLAENCIPTLKKEVDNFNTTKSNTVELELVDGIDTQPIEQLTWNIFPNPAKDILTVALENKKHEDIEITIINSIGQIIFQRKYRVAEKLDLDISDYKNGVYGIQIDANGSSLAKTFILSK